MFIIKENGQIFCDYHLLSYLNLYAIWHKKKKIVTKLVVYTIEQLFWK